MGLGKLLVICCFVGAALAGPLSRDEKCSQSCSSQTKFQYRPGQTYEYRYQGENTVSLGDNSQDAVTVKMEMDAHIEVLDECEMRLRVKNVKTQGPDGSHQQQQQLKQNLEKHPLAFSFDNGRIQHICASEQDKQESLNIKKGILTTLQNTMSSLSQEDSTQESDIAGHCETQYTVQRQSGQTIEIQKSKDLSSCSNTELSKLASLAAPYLNRAQVPLKSGEYNCTQTIKDQVIQKVHCQEESGIRPLSYASSGPKVQTKVHMQLQRTQNKVSSDSGHRYAAPSTLLYAFQEKRSEEATEQELREDLEDLCSKVDKFVDPEATDSYKELVADLDGTPYETIKKVYQSLKKGTPCKNEKVQTLFIDACAMAFDDGPAHLIYELIKEDELSSYQEKLYTILLAFLPEPSEETIEAAVRSVVEDKDCSEVHTHSVASVLYNFCNETENCEKNTHVRKFLQHMQQKLRNDCNPSNDDDEDEILMALKSLGNVGELGDCEEQVKKCMHNKDAPLVTRLAAIDAFRRVECEDQPNEKFLEILTDKQEDPEIRINAYLAVYECLEKEHLDQIREVIQDDSSTQVESFVISHIKNLQNSDDPELHHVQQVISSIQLPKNMSRNIWKYSRNYRYDYHNQKMDSGAAIDVDVIFNKSPFLRSINVNPSARIYGNEYDAELNLHLEGIDIPLQKIFGPDGQLYNSQIVQDLSSLFGIAFQRSQHGRRQKRSLFDSKKLDILDEQFSKFMSEDAKAAVSLKINDVELFQKTIRSAKDLLDLEEAYEMSDILKELAKDHNIDIAHGIAVVDQQFTLPTTSGVPVHLTVNGSLIFGLTTEGKAELRHAPKNWEVTGSVIPSVTGDLAVAVVMGNQNHGVKGEVEFSMASGVSGKVEVQDARLATLRLDMPEDDEILLFSLNSTMYMLEGEHERPVQAKGTRRFGGCSQRLANAIGHEICAKASIPKPFLREDLSDAIFYPLNGDVSIEVTLQKKDSGMRAIEIKGELPQDMRAEKKSFRLTLDTPGSRKDRKTSIEVQVHTPSQRESQKSVSCDIRTPQKKISGSASYQKTASKIESECEIQIDDKSQYAIKAECEIQKQGESHQYKPHLEITSANKNLLTAGGEVAIKTGQKKQLSFDLSAQTPNSKPAFLKGEILGDATKGWSAVRLSTDVQAGAGPMEVRVYGALDKQQKATSADWTVEYQKSQSKKQSANVNFKLQNLSNGELTKVTGVCSADCSQYPQYNWKMNFDVQHKPQQHYEHEIEIHYGEDHNDENRRIQHLWVSRISDYKKRERCTIENEVKLSIPQADIEAQGKAKVSYELDSTPSLKIEANGQLSEHKQAQLQADCRVESRKPLKLAIDIKGQCGQKQVSYSEKLEEKSPNEYHGKSVLMWARNKRAAIEYVTKLKRDQGKTHFEIDAQMDAPGFKKPMIQKSILKATRESVDIESNTILAGRPSIDIKAKVDRSGAQLSLDCQAAEGKLEINSARKSASAKFDFSMKKSQSRRVLGFASIASEPKKSVHAELSWDADRNPSKRIEIGADLQKIQQSRDEEQYQLGAKLQYKKDISAETKLAVSTDALEGPHNLEVRIHLDNSDEIVVTAEHKIEDGRLDSEAEYIKNGKQVMKVDLDGKYQNDRKHTELSCGATISSEQYKKIDGMEAYGSYVHADIPAHNINIEGRFKRSADRQYKAQFDGKFQTSGSPKTLSAHMKVQTPHKKWNSLELAADAECDQKSYGRVNMKASRQPQEKIVMSCEVQKTKRDVTVSASLETPFKMAKEAHLQAKYECRPQNYAISGQLEVNDEKMELSGNVEYKDQQNFKLSGHVDSTRTPKLEAAVQARKERGIYAYTAAIRKNSQEIAAVQSQLSQSDRQTRASVELRKHSRSLIQIEGQTQEQKDGQRQLTIKADGSSFEPISATIQYKKEQKNLQCQIQACKESTKECISLEGHYVNRGSSYYDVTHQEFQITAKKAPEYQGTVNFLLSNQRGSFQNKLIASSKGQKLGYTVMFKDGKDKDECEVRILMPQRTMKVEVELEDERDTKKVSIDFYADADRQPQRKAEMDLEYTIRDQRGMEEYKVELSAQHPSMTKPLYFKGLFKHQETAPRPVQLNMEFDFCEDPSKKVYTEFYLQHNNNDHHNRSAIVHFYTHDKSLIEFSANAHWAVNKERHLITSGLQWWMNTAKTDRYESHCFLKINTKESDKSIKFWHNSPESSFHATTTLWHKKNDKLYIEMDLHYNDQKRQAKLTIPDGQPCAEVQILNNGAPERRHLMCIRTTGRSLMRITAESQVRGKKVADFNVDFDKRNKEQFTMELRWDPESIRQAYERAQHWSSNLDTEDIEIPIVQEIVDRVKDAANILKGCNVFRPLKRFASSESQKISSELKNDFKKMAQALDDLTEDLPSADEIAEHIERSAEAFADWIEDVWEMLPSCPKCAQKWEQIVDMVRGMCKRGTTCYKVKYAYQRQGMSGVSDVIYSEMPELNDQVIKMVLTTKDKVKGAANVLRTGSYDYLEKIASCISEYISESAESLAESQLGRKISQAYEKLSDSLEDASQELRQQAQEVLEKFLSKPDVKSAMEVVEELLNEIRTAFDKIDMQKVSRMVSESISFVYDADQDQRVLIFDPQRGQMRIQVQSNAVTRKLKQTWQNVYKNYYNEEDDDCQQGEWHSEHDYGFLDSWNSAKSFVKKGLPPHHGHAMLVGDRHYVTFDDRVYDFEGQCSYLLARDFQNDTFSVIVKYHQGPGKTIAFVTPQTTIEIDTERDTVLVNGSPVETPYNHGDLSVDREEDEVTIEHDLSDAKVVCDLEYNVCEFFLPGWFFGKTGGLLGTYDNEPKNDFTTANGQRTNNIEEFTNSWTVNRNCQSRNRAQEREVQQQSQEYQLCHDYFMKKESPLRPAYYTVQPQEYFRMCLRHMAEHIPEDDHEDKLCTVASAYQSEAEFHGVEVPLPKMCLKCDEHHGQELEYGETKTYQQHQQRYSQKSADVVFVVEEHPANRPVVKDLTQIIRQLEREFQDQGFSNNRYGLAGYEGESVESEPHSHTARGNKFFQVQEFDQVVQKLNLQRPQHHQKNVAAFEALYYAARYPFRPSVAKVIVLLTSTPCQERNSKMSYSEIQRTMLQEGIQVHVIGQMPISIASSASKGSGIYGMDAESVFRGKDMIQKDLVGQQELRPQVVGPKDVCTKLAQETQGSYFSTKPLTTDSKNWRSVLVRRIAKSAEVPTCQRCQCTEYNGSSRTVCRLCNVPRPMQPSYSSKSQYNYHDDDY